MYVYAAETLSKTSPYLEGSFLDSKFFNPGYLYGILSDIAGAIFTRETLHGIYTVMTVLSLFFIAVIIYTTVRMFEIRKKEHAHLHHELEEYKHNQALREKKAREEGVFKNPRWKKVLDYAFSVSENDWRLAVIEADLMLYDLLNERGFKGDTVGDKLKMADRESFRTLDLAWDAHNVRNKIAHEGSDFSLSQHETRRVISLYENIFAEFGYI